MILLNGMKSGRSPFFVGPPIPPIPLGVKAVTGGSVAGATSVNVVVPQGCVADRSLLIIHVSPDSDGLNQFVINTPTGWTLRGERVQTRGAGAVFTRIVDQATIDAGVVNVSISVTSQAWCFQMLRIEGHDVDDPINSTTTRNFESNGTFFSPSSLTPSQNGSLFIYAVTGGWGAASFTTPATWTEEYDRNSGGSSGVNTSNAGGSFLQDIAANKGAAPVCSISIHRAFLFMLVVRPQP